MRRSICLRADVPYFLCCTRATKEIGDVCTQATSYGDHRESNKGSKERQGLRQGVDCIALLDWDPLFVFNC